MRFIAIAMVVEAGCGLAAAQPAEGPSLVDASVDGPTSDTPVALVTHGGLLDPRDLGDAEPTDQSWQASVTDTRAYVALTLQGSKTGAGNDGRILGRIAVGVWIRRFSPAQMHSLGVRIGATAFATNLQAGGGNGNGIGAEIAVERALASVLRVGLRAGIEKDGDAGLLTIGGRLYLADTLFLAADAFTFAGTVSSPFAPTETSSGVLIGLGISARSSSRAPTAISAAAPVAGGCQYTEAYESTLARYGADERELCAAGESSQACLDVHATVGRLVERLRACRKGERIGPPSEAL